MVEQMVASLLFKLVPFEELLHLEILKKISEMFMEREKDLKYLLKENLFIKCNNFDVHCIFSIASQDCTDFRYKQCM